MDERPASDDRNFWIFGFEKYFRLSDFKRSLGSRKHRRLIASKTDINWAVEFERGERRFFTFVHVAWRKNNHVRNDAHDRHVFDRLVRRAIRPHRNSRVRTDNFYRNIVVTDRSSYLLPISSRRKHGVTRDKRDLPVIGQARSKRRQILLGDTHLNKTLGIFFCEFLRAGRFRQIRAQSHHPFILVPCFQKPLAVAVARWLLLDFFEI